MRKKWFMILLSLCLLFCLPLTASATSDTSGRMPDSMLEPVDVVYYYNQAANYPASVNLYDFNSAILDHTTGTGNFNYHTELQPPYDEFYTGTFNFTELNGITYYRFSGTTSFYFFILVPSGYEYTVGTGQLSQRLDFGSISYYATINGTPTAVPVSQPHVRVLETSMISGIGEEFKGAVLRAGGVGDFANIAYRFSNAGFGSRPQYLKVTVEYSFLVYGTQTAPLPSDTLNGYARLALNNCSGTFDLSSGFMNQTAYMNQYTQQLQNQNDQMMNGYDNSSGTATLESGAASVDTGIQEEHAAIDSAGSLAADYDYESADLSELATAFSLISGWFMALIEALGSWNMLIYITLTMVVALFAIGYFRH